MVYATGMLSPLAHTIVLLRKRLRLSQGELAASVGVSRAALARWECGDRPVPERHLAPLAAGLGLSGELALGPLQAMSIEAGCTVAGVPRVIDSPDDAPYDNSGGTLEDMLALGTRARLLHDQGLVMLGPVLYGYFCEVFPRDRAHELLGAHYAVAAGAVPTRLSALHLGCQLLLVSRDGPYVYTGHYARPALVWTRGKETIAIFGQVTVGVVAQSRRYRVDLLVMYRLQGEPPQWMYVEFDGGYHPETVDQDARRAMGIGAMEIRFENVALQNADFFERRFLHQVRNKAAWAASNHPTGAARR